MKFFLGLFLFIISLHSYGQKLIPFGKSNAGVLQKIVNDIEYNFNNIIGEKESVSPEFSQYKSKICWSDSASCSVLLYQKSKQNNQVSASSWQAVFPAMESFKEAEKKFKKTYQQINNTTLQYEGKKLMLKTPYEAPDETIGFSTIRFEVGEEKKLNIDVSLTSEGMEWLVTVNIYSRTVSSKN